MDDNEQQAQQESDAQKFQYGMMLHNRYRPQAGRADRMAANIPGDFTSMGAVGDHTIGHGGSN